MAVVHAQAAAGGQAVGALAVARPVFEVHAVVHVLGAQQHVGHGLLGGAVAVEALFEAGQVLVEFAQNGPDEIGAGGSESAAFVAQQLQQLAQGLAAGAGIEAAHAVGAQGVGIGCAIRQVAERGGAVGHVAQAVDVAHGQKRLVAGQREQVQGWLQPKQHLVQPAVQHRKAVEGAHQLVERLGRQRMGKAHLQPHQRLRQKLQVGRIGECIGQLGRVRARHVGRQRLGGRVQPHKSRVVQRAYVLLGPLQKVVFAVQAIGQAGGTRHSSGFGQTRHGHELDAAQPPLLAGQKGHVGGPARLIQPVEIEG